MSEVEYILNDSLVRLQYEHGRIKGIVLKQEEAKRWLRKK